MDVVLGAAVTGPVARLALVDGSSGDRRDVIDQSTVDLGADPARDLADAIVGTQRLLIEDGHRLAATRVCWSDDNGMQALRRQLSQAGISDVASVRESDAALAKVCEVSRGALASAAAGGRSAALLFCDDDTATLSIVDANAPVARVWAAEKVADSDTVAACTRLLSQLSDECGGAGSLFLMGTSPHLGEVAKQIRAAAPIPLMVPDDTDLAFAHGATLAGFTADEFRDTGGTEELPIETPLDSAGTYTTSVSPQIGPQLAYSMVDDSNSLPLLGNPGRHDPGHIPNQSKMSPLSWADDDDEDDDTVVTGAVSGRPRFLLLGSGVAAAVVVAFAALAITVAIGIKPNAQQVAMAPPKAHAMPTFSPLPPDVQAPLPLDPGSVPAVEAQAPSSSGGGGPIPAELASAIAAPAAIPPGAPAPAALPDVPQGTSGPQLPGWGMPGFVMPPIVFNISNLLGAANSGWHWVTDSQGHLLWVPDSVQGASTVSFQGGGPTGRGPVFTPLATTGNSLPNRNRTHTGLTPDPGVVNSNPVLTPGGHVPAVVPQQPATPPVLEPPKAPVQQPVPPVEAPKQVPVPPVEAPKQVPVPPVEAPKQVPVPPVEAPKQVPVPPVEAPKQVPVPPVEAPAPAPIPRQPVWTPPVPRPAPVPVPQPPVFVPPAPQAPPMPTFNLPSLPIFQQPQSPMVPSQPLFPRHR